MKFAKYGHKSTGQIVQEIMKKKNNEKEYKKKKGL